MIIQNTINTHSNTKPVLAVSKHNLTGEISLILHTLIAQSLLEGSWGHKNMGLLQFAKLMQTLWEATKEDDPYAQWYLMNTYEQINLLKEEIKKVKLNCQEKFTALRALEIQIFYKNRT